MTSNVLFSHNPKIFSWSSGRRNETRKKKNVVHTWSHLPVSPCLCCRTEQFQASQWRRMKTREEGTGATRLSLSSPAWAMLWAWATSGGFPTSATGMEEVRIPVESWAHFCWSSSGWLYLCRPMACHIKYFKYIKKKEEKVDREFNSSIGIQVLILLFYLFQVLYFDLLFSRFLYTHSTRTRSFPRGRLSPEGITPRIHGLHSESMSSVQQHVNRKTRFSCHHKCNVLLHWRRLFAPQELSQNPVC